MNNTTGGILLFMIGAAVIAMGVSEKGKRIFNILIGEDTATRPTDAPASGGIKSIKPYSGGSETPGAFAGEKGAGSVNA